MSALTEALGDYLTLRRALGHKLDDAARHLGRFVASLDAAGVETVTLGATLAFVLDPSLDPASTVPSRRLCAVRGFARYLAGIDARTEIAPAGVVRYRARRRQPYLFSDAEITALMRGASSLARSPLRAATLESLIGLLAVTGMRVGEAIRLERADVNWDDALVTVRATKFAKSRQIPVLGSTMDALRAYAVHRDRALPAVSTGCFFVSARGTRLAYSHFCATFAKALDITGIGAGSPVRPRIHDLRHRFAVVTLLGWHRQGLDVPALLPRLSTYLGHREPRFTYTYLSATPELLGYALGRQEAAGAVTSS